MVDELVERLCRGKHPIKAGLLSGKTAEAFQKRIQDGYVHIEFTNTQGGTILGMELDKEASDLSKADFEGQSGHVHLVGGLVLNYEEVRCLADIDLATLAGEGCLETVAAVPG
jgi:Core binding factor beta subunit